MKKILIVRMKKERETNKEGDVFWHTKTFQVNALSFKTFKKA